MSSAGERQILCRKDGKPMFFVAESEKMSNGSRRTIYYYRCPVCGYRIEVEQVYISVEKDSIIVRRLIRAPPQSS